MIKCAYMYPLLDKKVKLTTDDSFFSRLPWCKMNVVSAHPWQALADDQIILRLSVEKFQPATISYARMFGKLSCIYLKARKVSGCDVKEICFVKKRIQSGLKLWQFSTDVYLTTCSAHSLIVAWSWTDLARFLRKTNCQKNWAT